MYEREKNTSKTFIGHFSTESFLGMHWWICQSNKCVLVEKLRISQSCDAKARGSRNPRTGWSWMYKKLLHNCIRLTKIPKNLLKLWCKNKSFSEFLSGTSFFWLEKSILLFVTWKKVAHIAISETIFPSRNHMLLGWSNMGGHLSHRVDKSFVFGLWKRSVIQYCHFLDFLTDGLQQHVHRWRSTTSIA